MSNQPASRAISEARVPGSDEPSSSGASLPSGDQPCVAASIVPEGNSVAGRDTAAGSDTAAVQWQLGRSPRGMLATAHRCRCGDPDVVLTSPRLPDGTPFPTTFYATCPRLTGAISTLESGGVMAEMAGRLASDPTLASAYGAAHDDYLARRAALGEVAEIAGISAGGMPTRVKCLHVLVAHALAAGPGVNPLGSEALAQLPPWWLGGPCAQRRASEAAAQRHPDPAQRHTDPAQRHTDPAQLQANRTGAGATAEGAR